MAANKIEDISVLWDEVAPYGGIVRVLVDHIDQLRYLEAFESRRANPRRWSVFVKIDSGGKYVQSTINLLEMSQRL